MKKILVIDDLPENVFMLQDRLEHEGFEVLTAYDGYTGIDKAKNELPDLILLDVMMPDITGLEVCKILVNEPTTKDIPIILVTAKSGAEDTKEGLPGLNLLSNFRRRTNYCSHQKKETLILLQL